LRASLESEVSGLREGSVEGAAGGEARQWRLDAARALQSEKAAVNQAVEQCEEAASEHRAFHFVSATQPISWQTLHSVNIDEVVRCHASQLESALHPKTTQHQITTE
jgi:hypothetical protein